MFKSPEQAVNYFASMAFYNRHVGEFVVSAFYYINLVDNLIKSF